jgi:hypothetical protein
MFLQQQLTNLLNNSRIQIHARDGVISRITVLCLAFLIATLCTVIVSVNNRIKLPVDQMVGKSATRATPMVNIPILNKSPLELLSKKQQQLYSKLLNILAPYTSDERNEEAFYNSIDSSIKEALSGHIISALNDHSDLSLAQLEDELNDVLSLALVYQPEPSPYQYLCNIRAERARHSAPCDYCQGDLYNTKNNVRLLPIVVGNHRAVLADIESIWHFRSRMIQIYDLVKGGYQVVAEEHNFAQYNVGKGITLLPASVGNRFLVFGQAQSNHKVVKIAAYSYRSSKLIKILPLLDLYDDSLIEVAQQPFDFNIGCDDIDEAHTIHIPRGYIVICYQKELGWNMPRFIEIYRPTAGGYQSVLIKICQPQDLKKQN